jgi:hypothetical protein
MKRPATDTKTNQDAAKRPDAGHDGRLPAGSSLDQKQHDNARQTAESKTEPGSSRPK